MLSQDDIRQLCERKYRAFLRSVITDEAFFPLDVRFGRPSPTADWDILVREIKALSDGPPRYTIDWEEVNTRRWGRQRLPVRVWFPDESAYLATLGKEVEVAAFRRDVAMIRGGCPALEGWLPDNVLRVIDHAGFWPALLTVCRFFLDNPRPNRYARELPIPVDTKFLERKQVILRSLLDAILSESAREPVDHFETRFGLRFDEPQIRMRFLDQALQQRFTVPVNDLAVPLSQVQQLSWADLDLLIVENKMTFLTLPNRTRALGIWGAGGAAELLTSVRWCAPCAILYWGDLDVHGFHILSRLRRAFPQVRSVMMDELTLREFRSLAVVAKPSRSRSCEFLTDEELRVYEQLEAENLLIEQEKLPAEYYLRRLGEALDNRNR